MPVSNKRDYHNLRKTGVFGNELRHWSNIAALMSDDTFNGTVTVRSYKPDYQGLAYLLTKQEAEHLVHRRDASELYFNESAPDDNLTIQGEYFHGVGGHGSFVDRGLQISSIRMPMRRALAQYSTHYTGVSSELILRAYMNENSYSDFLILTEQYPDHAIEFSCYNVCLGNREHRNTLIWECRAY